MGLNILISGGGIAGQALAYWLVRAGVAPVIVEAASELRTGGYMIDFWGVGYGVSERMGLNERLREIGYDIREIRLVDGRGHRKAVLTTDSMREALGGRYVSLLRGELVRELHRMLYNGVEVIFGDRVRSLAQGKQGVVVEFERGPARQFDAVVGADGVHSSVRRLEFGTDADFEAPLGYSVAAFTANSYPHRDEGVYLSRTIPGRQVVRCTLRGARSVFFIVLNSELTNGRSLDTPAEQRRCIVDAISGMRWEGSAIVAALEHCDDLYFDSVARFGCQLGREAVWHSSAMLRTAHPYSPAREHRWRSLEPMFSPEKSLRPAGSSSTRSSCTSNASSPSSSENSRRRSVSVGGSHPERDSVSWCATSSPDWPLLPRFRASSCVHWFPMICVCRTIRGALEFRCSFWVIPQ